MATARQDEVQAGHAGHWAAMAGRLKRFCRAVGNAISSTSSSPAGGPLDDETHRTPVPRRLRHTALTRLILPDPRTALTDPAVAAANPFCGQRNTADHWCLGHREPLVRLVPGPRASDGVGRRSVLSLWRPFLLSPGRAWRTAENFGSKDDLGHADRLRRFQLLPAAGSIPGHMTRALPTFALPFA